MSDEKSMVGTKNDYFSCCVMKVSSERPVSDKKCMFGTKNDHFLMLCHEGQFGTACE